MDLDSKYFDRIRIKPEHEPVRTDERLCEWHGCRLPGVHRAPKGRLREGQYFHFCLDHVRDYNKAYNYFDGMPDQDVDAFRKASTTGHRPTWKMGTGAQAPTEAPNRGWAHAFRDGFGAVGNFAARAKPAAAPKARPLKALERKSFVALDLEGHETGSEIKARYKALVKRMHPDANGGDRSSEDKLREIIQAYNHLKLAGFC